MEDGADVKEEKRDMPGMGRPELFSIVFCFLLFPTETFLSFNTAGFS